MNTPLPEPLEPLADMVLSSEQVERPKPMLLMDEKGRFLKGNAPGPGRPKGMKNAQTIFLKSAPKMMKAYVKEALRGNPSLLVDARKVILPVESQDGPANPMQVVIFLGDGTFPRPINPELMPEPGDIA